jgi:dGTPase
MAGTLQRRFEARHPSATDRFPSAELIETACLAHDLGHPPFGHAGERALNAVSDELTRHLNHGRVEYLNPRPERRDLLDVGGFEGNAQTFRIATYLSPGSFAPAGDGLLMAAGLDLTRATLDAFVKYPWRRGDVPRGAPAKWGAIGLDVDRLKWVRGAHGIDYGGRKSFEAQVMEWADDVAYAVDDLVDFYMAGLVPLPELFALPPRPDGSLSPTAFELLAGMVERQSRYGLEELRAAMESLARLVPWGVLPTRWSPTRSNQWLLQVGATDLTAFLIDGVSWRGEAPCRHEGDLTVGVDPGEQRLKLACCEILQTIVAGYVHESRALLTQQEGQGRMLGRLVATYFDSPHLLDEARQEELRDHGDVARAAVDQVASHTEMEAVALFERFTGNKLGSFTDLI